VLQQLGANSDGARGNGRLDQEDGKAGADGQHRGDEEPGDFGPEARADEVGSKQVTQFVGSIPPGRAPDHFHQYEEVLFILSGTGRMWAGRTTTAIGPGSCVYLPKGQVHCVENTGTDELRLLGVFYPAGSPSVRYEKE